MQTGAMITALKVAFCAVRCARSFETFCFDAKEGKVDVIVALTEGLVADIGKGSHVRLISGYVQSPLTWAIRSHRFCVCACASPFMCCPC